MENENWKYKFPNFVCGTPGRTETQRFNSHAVKQSCTTASNVQCYSYENTNAVMIHFCFATAEKKKTFLHSLPLAFAAILDCL